MLYSKASLLIGKLGPVVAWPLFMVLIILISNLWGWRHKEWESSSKKSIFFVTLSIITFIIAIILLAFATMVLGR